jgi:hypothetical protein
MAEHPGPNVVGRTVEQIVHELADRAAIEHLIATYAHRVMRGDANADLFTDDGAYIHRRTPTAEPVIVRGRAELDAHYVARPNAWGAATPMIHNTMLTVDGDDAEGTCVMELHMSRDGAHAIAYGCYEDRYRREAGRWKFVTRELTMIRWPV